MGLETALLAIGGGLYMREYEPSWVEINELTLTLPRLAKSFSGLRMVQISDLHFGGWMTIESLTSIVQMVNAQYPDIVVITGDFVMGHSISSQAKEQMIEHLDELAATLKKLVDRSLVFSVLGNHDYMLSRGTVLNMLSQASIKDLSNSVHTFERGNDRLHLAGIDDVMARYARMDLVESSLPDEGCAISLVHEPDFAEVSAKTGRFDLQLSGHSHGGQVVLPLLGPPVLPWLARKYPSGLYKVMDMYQYTNRGVGMTPPYIRFNCRPEITVFTLESA